MAQNGAVASNETVKIHEELKIVIVGDGGCGKTSLLMVYAKGDFPEDDYDRLRPLSYQEAHLIMVCYDVTNPTSFENVLIKWHPELKHFCKDIPVILIGCKTDLRKDKERIRKLKAVDQTPITYTQGEDVRQQMNAELYLECSAKHQENVEQVFQETTKTALEACRKARKRKRKRLCVAM
ncbi:rho-related GTP-binding protein RhoF isoform X2 [Gadus morhua]|uniref:rho-related GTP-binding protein RhoF isoform X2 n=1 Tax=Gadus morhua TaxID=8049 RepID=UPI0011B56F7A|nr:rho-related GTP-binding protein RhoF isoform X2 [Gadus morhua]XP_056444547.1 rho-related GTP-binding protein RhoF isoform X2 [Gadus chalcogrammus]XP_059906030.1 rho-related GTP-binding protein RhoF isoform X2 [Gadus macrocephalus]